MSTLQVNLFLIYSRAHTVCTHTPHPLTPHLLAGVVVFAFLFCIATLLFVPGIILTIGAGVAFGRAIGFGWGLLWGSVAVLAGAVMACIIAFYLGR